MNLTKHIMITGSALSLYAIIFILFVTFLVIFFLFSEGHMKKSEENDEEKDMACLW